jgi:hypothetical protein
MLQSEFGVIELKAFVERDPSVELNDIVLEMSHQPTSSSETGEQLIDEKAAASIEKSYPALHALRLRPRDLEALARNGTICQEHRGPRTIFKLRFRNERQIVRCIASEHQANIVKTELIRLRLPVVRERELQATALAAKQLIRRQTTQLQPMLATCGMIFHGLAMRRPHRLRRKA